MTLQTEIEVHIKYKMEIWWKSNPIPLSSSQSPPNISEFYPLTLWGVSLFFQTSIRPVARVNKYGMDSTVSSQSAMCLGSKGLLVREQQAGTPSRLDRGLYQLRNITVKKLQRQHWHNVDSAISTDSGIRTDYDSHSTAQRMMI